MSWVQEQLASIQGMLTEWEVCWLQAQALILLRPNLTVTHRSDLGKVTLFYESFI